MTVGQAELLMRKKMKQYLGLVTGAEDKTDGGNTTAEDLQVCAFRFYSGTSDKGPSDKGPSEIRTTSLQRTLVSTPC